MGAVFSWIVAGLFLALATSQGWGALMLFRGLSRVPPLRARAARLIVLSGACVCLLGVLTALTILLAHYRSDGGWKLPVLAALGVALSAALPGLGVYLLLHHEPWIQEWRGTAGGISGPAT